MSLCEVLVLADEHDGGNPKLPGLVLPEAVANNLSLTDVRLWRARTRIRTSQDVDSRLVEFFAQKRPFLFSALLSPCRSSWRFRLSGDSSRLPEAGTV